MPKFNIAEVAVTHTCYYEPSVYLEHCEAIGVEPSEEEYQISFKMRSTKTSLTIITHDND
jgi:hypothetical protein